MPDALAEFYVKVGSDFRKADTELERLHQRIKSVDPSIAKMESGVARLNKATMALGGIIAGIGVAKFGSDIIDAATKMDSLNRMLINVEGNQAKANQRFEQFRILAKEPVLDPFNLSRFYVGLKSVNVEGDLSIRFMKSLANAMAGVGAGNEQFTRSMEQFVQMMGKATLQGQDLRVMAESFPQIRKYLAEAFGGLTDPEAIAKAGYKSIDVLTKLNEVMEKSPKFAGGAQAAQDNFRQSLELFEGAIGKNLLPTFTKFLNQLTELMDSFAKLPEGVKTAVSVTTGLGLLATTLVGIASTIGIIKTGLAGLGAVNMANVGSQTGIAGMAAKTGGTAIAGTIGLTASVIALTAGAVYLEAKNWNQPLITPEKAESRIIENWQKFINKLEAEGKTQSAYAPGISVKDLFGVNKSIDLARQAKDIGYDLNYLQSLDDIIVDMQRRINDFQGTLYETKPLILDTSKIPPPVSEDQQKLLDRILKMPTTIDVRGDFRYTKIPEVEIQKREMPVFGELGKGLPEPKFEFDFGALAVQQKMAKQNEDAWKEIASLNEEDNRRRIQGDELAIKAFNEKNKIEIDGLAAMQALTEQAKKDRESELQDQLKNISKVGDAWNDLTSDMEIGAIDVSNAWAESFDNIIKASTKQFAMPIATRGIDQVFGKIFEGGRIEEAYKKYQMQYRLDSEERVAMGLKESKEQMLSFDEFSDHYRKQNEINTQSWKSFLEDMLEGWTKTLVKMEIEAEATNLYNFLRGKGYQGGGGIGEDIKGGVISKIGDWIGDKIKGGISEEMAGGVGGGESIAEKIAPKGTSLASKLPVVGQIAGTAFWGEKVIEAGYDYWKDKQKFEEAQKTPEGISKMQQDQKDMFQRMFGIGKYEPKGQPATQIQIAHYEDAMRQVGLEPYPLAKGGWVMKPTIALMGEREPELVIPKSKLIERGPESFNIQPLNKGSAGEIGGNSLNIESLNVYITETNPEPSVIESKMYMALQGLVNKGRISRMVLS